MKKEYWLISFDLDTKNKSFKDEHYTQIKIFMLNNSFIWIKDSNYLSKNKLMVPEIKILTDKFIEHFPLIALENTKFIWTISKPEEVCDLANYVAGYGKIILNEVKQNLKEMPNKNIESKYHSDDNKQIIQKLKEKNEKLTQENSRLLEENNHLKQENSTSKKQNIELELDKNLARKFIDTIFKHHDEESINEF